MTRADIKAVERLYAKHFYFEGTHRSVGDIGLLLHEAGIDLPRRQMRNRLRQGFDTIEKMRKPLAPNTQGHRPVLPRLDPIPVIVKYARNVVVDCVECGQDSPLMFWRIGNRERYRCTRCQTIFEVEIG